MIVNDFVMLGRTVPEPNRDKQVYVCSVGYCPTTGGLTRVYPLSVHDRLPRWQRAAIDLVPVTRKGDHRPASRSLGAGGFRALDRCRPEWFRPHFEPLYVDSIAEANRRRISLALLRLPAGWEFRLDRNPGDRAPHHEIWGPVPPKAKERFCFTPRLHFRDPENNHKIQVRDWGVFELMRKYEQRINAMTPDEQVSWIGQSLRLRDGITMLIGNYENALTAWCVISILGQVDAA